MEFDSSKHELINQLRRLINHRQTVVYKGHRIDSIAQLDYVIGLTDKEQEAESKKKLLLDWFSN
jgi:excinuclease UvrABC ATPase subunit